MENQQSKTNFNNQLIQNKVTISQVSSFNTINQTIPLNESNSNRNNTYNNISLTYTMSSSNIPSKQSIDSISIQLIQDIRHNFMNHQMQKVSQLHTQIKPNDNEVDTIRNSQIEQCNFLKKNKLSKKILTNAFKKQKIDINKRKEEIQNYNKKVTYQKLRAQSCMSSKRQNLQQILQTNLRKRTIFRRRSLKKNLKQVDKQFKQNISSKKLYKKITTKNFALDLQNQLSIKEISFQKKQNLINQAQAYASRTHIYSQRIPLLKNKYLFRKLNYVNKKSNIQKNTNFGLDIELRKNVDENLKKLNFNQNNKIIYQYIKTEQTTNRRTKVYNRDFLLSQHRRYR